MPISTALESIEIAAVYGAASALLDAPKAPRALPAQEAGDWSAVTVKQLSVPFPPPAAKAEEWVVVREMFMPWGRVPQIMAKAATFEEASRVRMEMAYAGFSMDRLRVERLIAP